MKTINFKSKRIRYLIVGITATIAHLAVQFSLLYHFPLWISNALGFFVGSLASYFGHALFTFQEITSGSIFARRWLFIQFSLNISISALLPLALNDLEENLFFKLLLILMPAFINFIIWSYAADYSRRRKS